jgi:hypothetical protein
MGSPQSLLLALPTELLDEIVENLDSGGLVHCRLTCRYFYYNIPPLSKHEQLLAAENLASAVRENMYACRVCLHLLPASKFADQMLRTRLAKGQKDARNRFCLECGLKPLTSKSKKFKYKHRWGPGPRLYSKGAHIYVKGERFIICWECQDFTKPARNLDGDFAPWCENCWPHCDEDYLQEVYMRQFRNSAS